MAPVALSDKEGQAEFVHAGVLSALSEHLDAPANANHAGATRRMRLEPDDGRVTSIVPVTTLPKLLNTTGLGHKIDFLSIDVEGAELSILNTIDFNRYEIGLLSIENDYNDPKCHPSSILTV